MNTELDILTNDARCEECGRHLHAGEDVVTDVETQTRVWCSPNCVNGMERAADGLLERAGV